MYTYILKRTNKSKPHGMRDEEQMEETQKYNK
jgi:hypothetical protein